MCGIFAYITTGQLPENLTEYFDKLTARGPDHSSTVTLKNGDTSIFLGFKRLAIVGTDSVSDPLLSQDDVYLVCNGEIYNYKYLIKKFGFEMNTHSDCEVILQLYLSDPAGFTSKIELLDGVFAFVLYDHRSGQVFSSRDRYGVRPLFKGFTGDGGVCFASEAKAIAGDCEHFNPGYIQQLEVKCPGVCVGAEWVRRTPRFNTTYSSSSGIIKNLLEAAVEKRLSADRPIGFLVSGGLDSSLVAAIAAKKLNKQITTFSIGLEGSPDLKAAKKVAQYLLSEHHEIIITTDDIISAIPGVVYSLESYDTTTVRASIPMYLIAKYIRENTDIKVVFSGEGADEVFGGYLYFHNAPSPDEFHSETERLQKELYRYDVCRSDRTISCWGLELRVPFLDADLTTFVRGIDPEHKMPRPDRMEKLILRDAFRGYLPSGILYRQKEAFSDGVGYNSVSSLKKYAEEFDAPEVDYSKLTAVPKTAEERYYHHLYSRWYSEKPGILISEYWMPKWSGDVTDPSATVLDVHKK